MIKLKKTASFLLAILMISTALVPYAYADDAPPSLVLPELEAALESDTVEEPKNESGSDTRSYSGNILVAVNDNTSSYLDQSFTKISSGPALTEGSSESDESDYMDYAESVSPEFAAAVKEADERSCIISDIDENGLYITEPKFVTEPKFGTEFYDLPDIYTPDDPENASASSSYSVGTTKTIYTIVNDNYNTRVEIPMICRYVGDHCTVWGENHTDPNSEYNKVSITAEIAEAIGEQYDDKYQAVIDAFGDKVQDSDDDGKRAILCYDIDRNIDNGVGNTYTMGYFYAVDLFQNDSSDYYFKFSNEMDCIHIDTYPGMSSATDEYLTNIPKIYSTLTHEFQHLINYSWTLSYTDSSISHMPSFLNEAFSMAAEHLVDGVASVSNRITQFSSSGVMGLSLLDFARYENYSLSYVFGQYLRTQYKQMPGVTDDGWSIYKEILEGRATENDSFEVIETLLDVDSSDLIEDFYFAILAKTGVGAYGFGGEEWANNIYPYYEYLGNLPADTVRSIGGSGARFFYFGSDALSGEWATFGNIDDDIEFKTAIYSGLAYAASAPTIVRTGQTEASVTFNLTNYTENVSTIYYSVRDDKPTSKNFTDYAFINGDTVELDLSISDSSTLWYYSEKNGYTSPVFSVEIPEYEIEITDLTIKRAGLFKFTVSFTANMDGTLNYKTGLFGM